MRLGSVVHEDIQDALIYIYNNILLHKEKNNLKKRNLKDNLMKVKLQSQLKILKVKYLKMLNQEEKTLKLEVEKEKY